MVALDELLGNVEIVDELSIKDFRIVFINTQTRPTDVIPLDIATRQNLVKVTEVSEEGVVNLLRIENLSDKHVICFRGDVLKGGKQNRVLGTTIILPPTEQISIKPHKLSGSIHPIPTTRRHVLALCLCVEPGRWSDWDEDFDYVSKGLYVSRFETLRSEVMTRSRAKLSTMRMLQGRTWSAIANHLRAFHIHSRTGDLVELLEGIEGDIEVPKNANGVIIYYKNELVWGEIYNIPNPQKHLNDTVKSILIDIYAKAQRGRKRKPTRTLLRELMEAHLERVDSIGCEEAYIIRCDDVMGFLVCLNGKPVYLEFMENTE